jgi:hypothetical protein
MDGAASFLVQTQPANYKDRVYDAYQYTVWNGNAPIQVCHILQDIYRAPLYPQLPVRFLCSIHGESISEQRIYVQHLITKPGKVDSNEPSGYHVCADALSVLRNPKTIGNTESVLKLMLDVDEAKQPAHSH